MLEALFKTREEKAIDLHFTVGEAIACAAAGPVCTAAKDQWEALKSKKRFAICLQLFSLNSKPSHLASN